MRSIGIVPVFLSVTLIGCDRSITGDSGVPLPQQSRSLSAAFPSVIRLPNGFQPEGIAIGGGHTFFTGSIIGGAIYRGDLRTGAGDLLVQPQMNGSAVGMSFDSRSHFLFVAGGFSGSASVYDARTGELKAAYQLNSSLEASLVNDVVVTRTAAYFTDSFRSFIYRVPLGPGGRLPPQSEVVEIPLGGDFMPGPGAPLGVSANGIDATPDGKYLILNNSDLGTLYRVDPVTGHALLIDLAGVSLVFGDGILLDGFELYVVQNLLNQIAVVRLNIDRTRGTLTRVINDSAFRIPATVAAFGNSLYAVNARFDVAPPTMPADPATEFEIVRVSR